MYGIFMVTFLLFLCIAFAIGACIFIWYNVKSNIPLAVSIIIALSVMIFTKSYYHEIPLVTVVYLLLCMLSVTLCYKIVTSIYMLVKNHN